MLLLLLTYGSVTPCILEAVCFSYLIWSTVGVELTLRWDQVSEIYSIGSVGRLIALCIGIVGLLRTLKEMSMVSVRLEQSWGELLTLLSFSDSGYLGRIPWLRLP